MSARLALPGLMALLFVTPAAAEPPPLVETAIAAAVARLEPGQRWAFTRSVTIGGDTLSARYDPTQPRDTAWTLIVPTDPAALTGDLAAYFERMRADDTPDLNALVGHDQEAMETYVGSLGDPMTMTHEDDAQAVFAFVPYLNNEGRSLNGHLDGELVVEKATPLVTTLRYFTTGSFKPAPVARIDSFDMTLRFAEIEPGGPVAIVESARRLTGSALFRSLDQAVRIVTSDFVRVTAPASAALAE
jgi:hypothetical protein